MGTRERAKTSWQLAAHNCERDLASLAGEGSIFGGSATEKLERLLAELEPLSCRYDVVVANPPYMGSSSLGKWMGAWVKKHYPEAYRDLCTGFIDRGFALSAADGYSAMVTMQSWMFLGSFEKLRGKILRNHSISSMAHLGTRAFGAIAGEVVSTTATVFANAKSEVKGAYFRLVDMGSEAEKQEGLLEALANPDCGWFYRADADGFGVIPGSPIAYWATKGELDAFNNGVPAAQIVDFVQGLKPGDTERFIRAWHEVSGSCIFAMADIPSSFDYRQFTWYCLSNGGDYRKWFGNVADIVNWKNQGAEIRNFKDANGKCRARVQNERFYFNRGLTWSALTSGPISVRVNERGVMCAGAGYFINANNEDLYMLGFLNSSVSAKIKSLLTESLNNEVGDLSRFPVLKSSNRKATIEKFVLSCIEECQADWDAFEVSRGFRSHPLI